MFDIIGLQGEAFDVMWLNIEQLWYVMQGITCGMVLCLL